MKYSIVNKINIGTLLFEKQGSCIILALAYDIMENSTVNVKEEFIRLEHINKRKLNIY